MEEDSGDGGRTQMEEDSGDGRQNTKHKDDAVRPIPDLAARYISPDYISPTMLTEFMRLDCIAVADSMTRASICSSSHVRTYTIVGFGQPTQMSR